MKILKDYLMFLQETGFSSKHRPHGWTLKSVKKTGKTISKEIGKKSPKEKGFFEKCVAKMKSKVKSPEGYCASLKDRFENSTYWRGKGKTKKEVKKDIKKHPLS